MTQTDTLLIGITQLINSRTRTANRARMEASVRRWVAHGADVVVFPECALTGFSARPETPCDAAALEDDIAALHALAIAHGVTVLAPTIVALPDGAMRNGGWWLKPDGERVAFAKEGLTESEQRFFTGHRLPESRVVEHRGVWLGLIICRELKDTPTTYLTPDPSRPLAVVLWPTYWGWDEDTDWDQDSANGWAQPVRDAVVQWGCPLLQANYCANAGDPRPAGPNGRSAVVSADGALFATGPTSEFADLAVHLKRDPISARWDVARVEVCV